MDQLQVKNLVQSDEIYNKYNSFKDFSTKGHLQEKLKKVLANLIELNNELSTWESSYKKNILVRAMGDILLTEDRATENMPRFRLHPNVIEEMDRIPPSMYSRYLYYRYRYEVFPFSKELDSHPPCVQIEPTSVCNFRCVFCYQTDENFTAKGAGHMGTMSLEMFKNIIDQVEGHVEAITLASRGEPLICKDLGKMLEYMNGKFLAGKLNTNASLLNEAKCHEILSSDIQTLVYSADAAAEPLYSQLRVNGNLDRVLANVNLFREIKEKHYSKSKLITRVSGVKVNDQQDIADMEETWGGLVDQIAFVGYNPWENTYLRPMSEVETPCTDLWRRAFIWFDGKVNPCDVDYKSHLAVGNIQDLDIADLWKGDNYSGLRKSHLDKKRGALSPCNRCTVI